MTTEIRGESRWYDRVADKLVYDGRALLGAGMAVGAFALGAVTWEAASAHTNQPAIEVAKPRVLPECPVPSKRAVSLVHSLFKPHQHKSIYPGVAAEQLGLHLPIDDLNLFYNADSVGSQPAKVNAHIAAANSQLKDSGLKLVVGSDAYAKRGWQVPSSEQLQSGVTEDNFWEITGETVGLPAEYVSLSGIKKIALMYKKDGPKTAVFSTGKYKNDTIVYNIAYDQFTAQTFPIDQQIARQINQEACGAAKTTDRTWEKINGRDIYGFRHHRGLIAAQPTNGNNNLLLELGDRQYYAEKRGDKKEFCRLQTDIAQLLREKAVVLSPQDFASEATDKADIGSMVAHEYILGWTLGRETPKIREKMLLYLERLEDLNGPGQRGPAVVKYFAETYAVNKPTTKNKIKCD